MLYKRCVFFLLEIVQLNARLSRVQKGGLSNLLMLLNHKTAKLPISQCLECEEKSRAIRVFSWLELIYYFKISLFKASSCRPFPCNSGPNECTFSESFSNKSAKTKVLSFKINVNLKLFASQLKWKKKKSLKSLIK